MAPLVSPCGAPERMAVPKGVFVVTLAPSELPTGMGAPPGPTKSLSEVSVKTVGGGPPAAGCKPRPSLDVPTSFVAFQLRARGKEGDTGGWMSGGWMVVF